MADEFKPAGHDPQVTNLRPVELAALARAEQGRRWENGERVRIEAFLEQHPALADPDALLDLIFAEVSLREQHGERPGAAEYQERFPQHADRLTHLFQAHESLKAGSLLVPASLPSSFRVSQISTGPEVLPPRPPPKAGPDRQVLPAIPGYELLGRLGKGGMGVVYKARQVKADRLVALKMILAGDHADASELARFKTEAEAAARLQHPGIVQVFEVGEHQGLPFFSLEFCPGGSLRQKLAGTPLPANEAAALVERLARAVQAAHDKGVIHRDLKPANVLLAEDGSPKVADFGLAKKLDEAEGQTREGAVMGTPSYMAPEQARGQTKEVGPAADVWALGAILYTCLTGRPPFQGPTAVDTLRQVTSDEPVPVRALQPTVPLDLETICHKCLQKELAKRYASAGDLAEELRRFQAGEPIRARPVGLGERAWRWCRRNPVVAGLVTAVAAMLLLGAAVASGLAVWALGERDRADQNATTANDAARTARDEERQKDRQLTRAEGLLYAAQMQQAQQHWEQGNVVAACDLLDSARWDYRDFEHRYLHTRFNASHLTFLGHTDVVTSVAFSPDGERLASGSWDKTVKVRDARTGQEVLDLKGHTNWVYAVAFSPNGQRIASGSHDQTVRVWDAQTGQQVLTLKGHTHPVTSVAFSPDGKHLASGSADRTVKVWDAQTGQHVLTLKGHIDSVHSVAFSPDGQRIASGSHDQTVRVWDAQTGQPVLALKGHTDRVSSVAVSPDGKRLASGSHDQTVRVWDAQTGQPVLALQGHTREVTSVAFSPDGKRIASASYDQAVKVWDAQTGQQVLTLKGHTHWVTSVAFSPDGKRIASAAGDQTVKVWDAYTGQQDLALQGHTHWVHSVCFSPDGKRVASGSGDRTVKVWDAQMGQQVLEAKGHTGVIWSVAFSPDGQRIASGSHDQTVRVWDAQTGQHVLTLKGHIDSVHSVAFSPDGKHLASGSWDKTVKVWDAQTGQGDLDLKGHSGEVTSVAFSPDGKHLASGSWDKTVKVWDAQTGQEVLGLQGHTGVVSSVAFSPDGKRLASGSRDQTVKVWDAYTGQQVLALQGHTHWVHSVCFSPDGKRVASGSGDQTVKVWDAQMGQQVLDLKGHTGIVWSVAFSPDGKCLASGAGVNGGKSGEVKVWGAQTGQQVLALKGHTDAVSSVAFSQDGKRVIAASGKEVRAWDARTGQPILPCTDPAPLPQQQSVSPDGQRLVRIVNGQPVVQPRVLHTSDRFNERLQDQARTHLWHLRMAQEARRDKDPFALRFHLRPLLLTAFTRWQGRPHDSFPLWAWRPPLTASKAPAAAPQAIALTETELRRLLEELDQQVQVEPKAWEAWAARGWCRHLLGNADDALADLKLASDLRPDEPGLWALRGTVCLKHQRPDEAEVVQKQLAAWQGIDVQVWHWHEVQVCEAEGAKEDAAWHRKHLPDKHSK